MKIRGLRSMRLCATALLLLLAGACKDVASPELPPSQSPSATLVFTPTDMAVPGHEPALNQKIARWSPRYQVEHKGDTSYISYHDHGSVHRLPEDYPAGSTLTLLDVTTPQGTHTYLHLTRYSRFLLNYGNVLWSALYEMRGDDAVKITPVATMGFLQAQARMPMPGIYIDPTGDLYVLDPQQVIKVVRDGNVVATGDATKLPLHEPGGLPRFLFLTTVGEERILCVLKPKPRGLSRLPNEDDFDAKFTIQRP